MGFTTSDFLFTNWIKTLGITLTEGFKRLDIKPITGSNNLKKNTLKFETILKMGYKVKCVDGETEIDYSANDCFNHYSSKENRPRRELYMRFAGDYSTFKRRMDKNELKPSDLKKMGFGIIVTGHGIEVEW